MPRYKMTVCYNGQGYCGFQTQKKQGSIQEELEGALFQILRERLRVVPSGRTDSGVHALAQNLHVDVCSDTALTRIQTSQFLQKINRVLSPQIRVLTIQKASPEYHARKQARLKSYVYWLLISPHKNPFVEPYVWRIPKPLDEVAMKKAALKLVGRHDFSSFCASDATVTTKVREVYGIEFSHKSLAPFFKLKGEKYIRLEFTGSGFLKQMVRTAVGTLVAVGQGKLSPQDVAKILKAKDRKLAGRTAPAQGLFLHRVQ